MTCTELTCPLHAPSNRAALAGRVDEADRAELAPLKAAAEAIAATCDRLTAANGADREGLDGSNALSGSQPPYATGGIIHGSLDDDLIWDRDHVVYPDGTSRCVYTIRKTHQ